MDQEELIRYWLYMQALEHGVNFQFYRLEKSVFPKEKESEWLRINWKERQKEVLKAALNDWKVSDGSGMGYAHTPCQIGMSIITDLQGITSRYKNISVIVKWSEVKKFIKTILEPKDEQINLIELLAIEAGGLNER